MIETANHRDLAHAVAIVAKAAFDEAREKPRSIYAESGDELILIAAADDSLAAALRDLDQDDRLRRIELSLEHLARDGGEHRQASFAGCPPRGDAPKLAIARLHVPL